MSETKMIIARMGYAESSYASLMIFVNESESFHSGIAAIQSLAQIFLAKYLYSQEIEQEVCCIQATGKFCGECGRSLKAFRFNPYDFEHFINAHARHTMDEYGETIDDFGTWTEFANFRSVLKIQPSEILEIPTYAERILIKSLNGDELDDDDCPFKPFASIYKLGLMEYESWTPDFGDPKGKKLEEAIESYRL